MAAQAYDQKNTLVSMSQEEDDYLFHLHINSLLFVEEPVDIDELLGYEQDGSRKDSVAGGRKPEVSSQDINKINSHEEAPTDSTHAWIDTSELPDPQISIDDINHALRLLDGSEPIEGATNIREDNQTRGNLAHVALMDSNPIQRGDDELARIRRSVQRGCQGYESEMTSVQRNNYASTSNISSCSAKSEERIASNEKPLLPRKHTSNPQRHVLKANDFYLNHNKDKENEKMYSGRKPESPSSSSLHLSARQGHCLSLVPSSMERHLGPEPIEGATNIQENNQTRDNLANVALMDSNPVERRGDDELARIRRCIERSCQDYESEMISLQRNNYASTSNISSYTTKSDKWNALNEKPVLPRKHTSDPQRCVLQGNGSCLNHYKGKENEKMSFGRKTESPSSSSLHLSARQGHCLSLVPSPMERHLGPSENEVRATKDFCWSPPKRTMKVEFKNVTNQQLNQNMKRTMKAQGKRLIDPSSSGSNHEKEEESVDLCQSIPQRKRHKSDVTGEGGSCRNCRCKKSKCKKLYCECFAAGVYCTGPCSCKGCENKPKDTALQACTEIESCKPPAFVPKAVPNSDSSPQIELKK